MRSGFGAGLALLASTTGVAQGPLLVTASQTLSAQKPFLDTMLPTNSEVWLSMANAVSTKSVSVGTRFPLSVSRDVMIGNSVVIPRGTLAHGKISYRTGKGAFGKSAKMEFDLIDVEIGGRLIPLAGHYRVEGEGNTGATVGAIAVVGLVGAAFVTGRSATAAQGSEWRAYTTEPVPIAIEPVKAMTEVARVSGSAQNGQPALPSPNAGRKLPNEDVIEVVL